MYSATPLTNRCGALIVCYASPSHSSSTTRPSNLSYPSILLYRRPASSDVTYEHVCTSMLTSTICRQYKPNTNIEFDGFFIPKYRSEYSYRNTSVRVLWVFLVQPFGGAHLDPKPGVVSPGFKPRFTAYWIFPLGKNLAVLLGGQVR